uniref:Galectin n=1 Tax=Holotrichia oblita TaxID=644536 RepID=A0A8D4LNV9_HOLOL|nr:lectin 1 [Holotrichia oblita]
MEVELRCVKEPDSNKVESESDSKTNKNVLVDEVTYYGWPIPNGFPPGFMVRIQGLAHRGGKRFEVNFALGSEYQSSNIAFHSSVRFGEGGDLVNNSYNVKKRWEEEERFHEVPITPGQNFEVLILCEATKFKIAIDGEHFCDFNHRIPFTNIKHLDIRGDATITLLSFEDNTPQKGPSIEYGYPLP